MSLRAHVSARVGRLDLEVALDTAPGTLVLVGPNGAGKTTLLSALLGLRPVRRAVVAVADTVLHDTDRGLDVPPEQRRLGYVPQDYALFPHLTVRRNVEFALSCGAPGLDARGRRRRADELLADLGIEALAERRPHTLSGGEQQRVALARALAVQPRALLLDEPLAALDVHSRREIRAFLAGWLDRVGLPTLLVTHDPHDARALGHQIAVLEAGRITQTGTWDELAARPASPFVAGFVASSADPGRP